MILYLQIGNQTKGQAIIGLPLYIIELISKTSYIHSYMLLICRSGHSKEANFQHKIYCKWKMLILIEI